MQLDQQQNNYEQQVREFFNLVQEVQTLLDKKLKTKEDSEKIN